MHDCTAGIVIITLFTLIAMSALTIWLARLTESYIRDVILLVAPRQVDVGRSDVMTKEELIELAANLPPHARVRVIIDESTGEE